MRAPKMTRFAPVIEPVFDPNHSRLVITVAVGKSRDMLDLSEPFMRAYATRIGADFIALTNVTQEWPLAEKFRVGHYARQYAQTLFVDADVFIRPTAPDIFEWMPNGWVGVYDDMPDVRRQPGGDRWLVKEQEVLGQSQGCTIPSSRMVNTGVVVCSRETADIWDAPSLPFPQAHCMEQHWITYQITPERTFLLDRRWNFQWWARKDFSGIEGAEFIHLAGMSQMAGDTAIATMRALALGAPILSTPVV